MNVEHQKDQQRFVVHTDAGDAELAYMERDGRLLDLHHTHVPSDERGAGIGDSLVRAALRFARDEGYRIIPGCAFVRSWFNDHPDERELVAAG